MSKLIENFKWWFFRKIVAKEVIQGDHMRKIINMYRIIREEAEKEFTEDNKPTLDGLLLELNAAAMSDLPEVPLNDRIIRSVHNPRQLPNVGHYNTIEIFFHNPNLYKIIFNGNYMFVGEDKMCAFPSARVEAILATFWVHFKHVEKFDIIRDERGRDY
jgi:hypothetical protein